MPKKISPELAEKTLDLINSTLEMIAAEQQKPLSVGTPAMQGHCAIHPDVILPLRATKAGAQEDSVSHMTLPGSHHVMIHEVPDWHLGLPDDVITLMTATPDARLKLPRAHSITELLAADDSANPESTPTETESD